MGKLNGKNYPFTVDTGSSHTLVHTDLIPDRYLETAESKLYGITGLSTKLFGPINVKLDIAGLAVDHPVYATKMSEKVILGLDFMTKYDCTIDLLCMTMSIGGNKIQLQKLYGIQKINNSGTIVQVKAYNVIDHNALMHNKETKELPCHVQDLYERSVANLSNDNDKLKVKELLIEYSDIFSAHDNDLGLTDLIQHEIDTGDHHPIKVPPRSLPPAKRQEAETMLHDMAESGLIEPSNSPWSSALVLVHKKDGSLRPVVDYRLLNSVTKRDSYPLPRIDNTLDALVGAKLFQVLDLKSGYFQVKMADKDKEKTAFSIGSGSGLWQFKVMPQGLCNSPSTFTRLMEQAFSGLYWKTCLIYLDDVISFARTLDEALSRLREIFDRLRTVNLKLGPKKCALFQKEVRYLGHVVSENGVHTDPGKTKSIDEWPTPRTKQELHSFIGLCTYYRRYVKDFARICAPLHHLMKKNTPFHWTEECASAFNALKRLLTTSPILAYPDPTLPFILDTDASQQSVGGVLSQIQNGQEKVIAYYSRTLSGPEKNYCITRKELLAVISSVNHFHHYLYGQKFLIRTDHSALQWLKKLKNPEGQLARWIAKLDQYNYDIQHSAGLGWTA